MNENELKEAVLRTIQSRLDEGIPFTEDDIFQQFIDEHSGDLEEVKQELFVRAIGAEVTAILQEKKGLRDTMPE